MNDLTRFEALRLSAILNEAIERFVLLEHITPDVTTQRDDLVEAVGNEIAHIIEDQRLLQVQYEQLLQQRQTLKAQTNKVKLQEVQREIERVSKELTAVTQALCRHIKENPNISENLKKIQRERSDLLALLRSASDELRRCSMVSLVSAVEAEKQQQDALLETVARQRENNRMVEQLHTALDEERKQRAQDQQARQATIADLKESLATLREDTMMRTLMMQRETSARLNALQRVHAQRLTELDEEIALASRRLEVEQRVAKETAHYLARRNEALGRDLSEWQERLATEVDQASNDLRALKEQLADTVRRYDELTQSYDAVVAFLAEEKRMQEEKARFEAEQARRHKAAFEIQALWLGYRERKAMADEKRRKKTGGKKKAGKK